MILSIIGSLVSLVLPVALVVGVVILVRRRRGGGADDHGAPVGAGQSVRRFFQYLLLAGLLFAAAAGVSGLIGRLLDLDRTVAVGPDLLALQLALTVIAAPLWGLVAWWTHRQASADQRELSSLGWGVYLTLVDLVSLVTAMVGWYQTLTMLTGAEPFRGSAAAMALVWTLVWAGHRWWRARGTPRGHLAVLRLLGALVGLVTAAVGLVELTGAALRELTGLGGDSILGLGTDPLLRAGALLGVGAVVWVVYWLRDVQGGPRTTGWLALVLLAGVGGGLIAAVSAVSVLGYDVLVWLVGDPASPTAAEHFADAPDLVGWTVVGLLVWWYHQAVLDAGRSVARTEVRRVYEYLMAAVGLLAAAVGLVMVLVTVVEAVAARSELVIGGSALNALLASLVLLAVGLPVWWWHWRLAQRARAADPAGELASITRRTYLLVLFGVAGVAAVVALITLAYLVLEDALDQGVDVETMRRIRFALGILVTTSLLSAYHWTVFRSDRHAAAEVLPGREVHPQPVERRTLLVVADLPTDAADELARRTGALVQLRRPVGSTNAAPAVDDVLTVASQAPPGDLLVLALEGEVRAIPLAPTRP